MGSVETSLPSEAIGDPLGDRPSLWAAFASSVASTPEALGLACVHQAPGLFGIANLPLDDDSYHQRPYLRWSFQGVHEGILRVVKAWRTLGVREGATLVTFAQNGAEYVLAAWAAVAMGCNIMPITPRNLTNTEEVICMVRTGLSISNGIKPVILAGNEQLATAIDELGVFPEALKIIVATESSTPSSGWIPLQKLMDSTSDPLRNGEDVSTILGPSPSETGGSILFTSGTTSLPKGIFHPYQTNMARVFPYRSQAEGHGSFGPGARLACNLPNNHAMGWVCMISSLTTGTALVYPGLGFDPALMLGTLFGERVTHIMLVPTMAHALVAAKAGSSKYRDWPLSGVQSVLTGGSSLTTEHVRLLTRDLGIGGVENFFGCTEGVLTSSQWTSDPARVADGHDISVGWPMCGYRVRIVDPETGEVVPRGVLGEIHGSGPTVLGSYIGGVGKDAWYMDAEGVTWYKTGDQGRMDEWGRLFITGRYKDMIIRGGENISPGAVEAVLAKNALLSPLLPQVVGAKDAIAGEVPVAVIKGPVTPEIRDTIQAMIIQHMGALYVPEDVLSTEDLSLAEYPHTASGKVQKAKLAALVNEYLSKPVEGNANGSETSDGQLTEEIRTIWAEAVGLDPSHVRLDAPVGEFADSITVMRVRERIKRQTGKTLSLQDMTEAGTIERQIEILRAMREAAGDSKTTQAQPKRPSRLAPLGVDDMIHLVDDPELFGPTKKLVVETVARYGLGWEDVEDVMPAYDFNAIMSQTKLNEDWTWHFAMQPVAKIDKAQLRKALEAVITNNRILASFMVWDAAALGSDDALHVVMKQDTKFFDLIIEDGGSLTTVSALAELPNNLPRPDWVTFPGPMYRALLYDIAETGGAAMVISANHAVIDASLGQMIQDDLDRALATVARSPGSTTADVLTQLHPHVDYKPWADSYFSLRTSAEARAATKWHVQRLQSIADHVRAGALFPQKIPTSLTPRRLAAGLDAVSISFDVPDIHRLRREHPSLTATVVVKAAVALMNVHRTGCSAAVFGNLEAGRRYFPFLPKAVLEQVGAHLEATDVSGPAFQMVFNVVEVGQTVQETVLGFMGRMQEDQALLTKYATVPLREVMKGLDRVSPGAGELLPRIIDTQHFNWVPGLGTSGTEPHQHVKRVAAVNRPTTGLIIHAGLGGRRNQTVFLNVYGDGVYVGREEAAKAGAQVEAITKWLVTSGNWEAPVAGFTDSLKELY